MYLFLTAQLAEAANYYIAFSEAQSDYLEKNYLNKCDWIKLWYWDNYQLSFSDDTQQCSLVRRQVITQTVLTPHLNVIWLMAMDPGLHLRREAKTCVTEIDKIHSNSEFFLFLMCPCSLVSFEKCIVIMSMITSEWLGRSQHRYYFWNLFINIRLFQNKNVILKSIASHMCNINAHKCVYVYILVSNMNITED